MADRDRAVLVEQQHAHGLAYDIASADDNALPALYGDLVLAEHFHHSGRCAGQKIVLAEHDLADVDRVEGVDVLFGADPLDHRLVVKVLGQRKLDEDPVDVGLFVERIDEREQLLLSRFGRERVLLALKANESARLLFIVYIYP